MGIIHLVNQIPKHIMNETKQIMNENIAVFRPEKFLSGMTLESKDYSIIITPNKTPVSLIENKQCTFGRNRMIILNPETRLKVLTEVPNQSYITVCIDKDFLQNVSLNAFGKKDVIFTHLDNPSNRMFLNFIKNFEYELLNYSNSCKLMVQSISYQIVIHLLRAVNNNVVIKNNNYSGKENYISKAIEYMHTYYNANININDICKDIHLSPYHFIRMFKEKTGYTPHDYLLMIRIKSAEDLLKREVYSIDEISRQCGFVNQGHFSTRFKSVKGISPSTYRKMNI